MDFINRIIDNLRRNIPENGVGFVFFFSVLAIVVQNINAELNFDRGISERNKRLDEELLSLALEMKKEGQ